MKNGFRIMLIIALVAFLGLAWLGIASRSWVVGVPTSAVPTVSVIAPEAEQRIMPGPLPEVAQGVVPTTQPEMARSVIDSSTVSIQAP